MKHVNLDRLDGWTALDVLGAALIAAMVRLEEAEKIAAECGSWNPEKECHGAEKANEKVSSLTASLALEKDLNRVAEDMIAGLEASLAELRKQLEETREFLRKEIVRGKIFCGQEPCQWEEVCPGHIAIHNALAPPPPPAPVESKPKPCPHSTCTAMHDAKGFHRAAALRSTTSGK